MNPPIRVLIVDDSALVRQILTKGLSMDPGIEVIGTAHDPFDARDKIVSMKPDVLTLDVEMPRMDGLEFIRRLIPQYPIPVVMVSSLTERGHDITLNALAAGAIDFVTKPKSDLQNALPAMIMELRTKVKIASMATVRSRPRPAPRPVAAASDGVLGHTTDKLVVIGASTGGTEAITLVLRDLPPNSPGILIVQHMPPGFTTTFAKQLNDISRLTVKEAEDGDRVMTGQVLLAPGAKHMEVLRSGGQYRVSVRPGDPVCGHCPSVEVLMQSAARYAGPNATGVILTGMGKDGASGLKAMRDAGSRTIGQDESSCIVYGMPKEAARLGAVETTVSIEQVGAAILRKVS